MDSGINAAKQKEEAPKGQVGDLDDSMEQIGEGEMSSGDDEQMVGKASKKEGQGDALPQLGLAEDVNERVDPDPIQDPDDIEEVCLSRADIKEMQRIHEELELENEKLKTDNESLRKQVK